MENLMHWTEVAEREYVKKEENSKWSDLKQRARIRQEFKNKGLPVKAILPESIFNSLTAGFYNFASYHHKDRTVNANPKLFSQWLDLSTERDNLVAFITIVLSALVTPAIYSYFIISSEMPLLIGIITCITLIGVHAGIVYTLMEKMNIKRSSITESLATIFMFASFPLTAILILSSEYITWLINHTNKKKMWPNKSDDKYGSALKATISIPPMPATVNRNVQTWVNLNKHISIVLHEDAFSADVSRKVAKDYIAKTDPLFVHNYYDNSSNKNFVIIIDAYGTIPEETSVIEKAVNVYDDLMTRQVSEN